jgi:16S rRNA U516 pseudouridylate synthase RsuA-like enzyme
MASLLTSVTYLKNVHWYRSQYTLKHAVKLLDQVQVIYKSKNYLILNKPADLICYQFNESYKNVPSLYDYLKEKFPFNYDPRITGGK